VGIPRIVGWRHGAAHPETWDDIGVFGWLVETTLATALAVTDEIMQPIAKLSGQEYVDIGARQAEAAPARGDGDSPGGGLE